MQQFLRIDAFVLPERELTAYSERMGDTLPHANDKGTRTKMSQTVMQSS